MSVLLDQIEEFLEQKGTTFARAEDFIEIRILADQMKLIVKVTTACDDPLSLAVLGDLPIIIPESKRVGCAELITRINASIVQGCFILDMSSGIVYFKIILPLEGADLAYSQLHQSIGACAWTFKTYFPSFCRYLYSDDLSPIEAFAEAEMNVKDPTKAGPKKEEASQGEEGTASVE